MKVKDILPTLSLMRNQRVSIYTAPEGMQLKTIPRDTIMNDPYAAVGEKIWTSEIVQISSPSAETFNLIVTMPHGR